MFEAALYRKEHGQSVVLDVLRGSQKLSLKIPVIEQAQHGLDDVMSMADPEKGLIQPLGILGVEITPKLAEVVQDLRINSGVIVAA
jgi:hypothetical protein